MLVLPKISIIIPIYNAEMYLVDCLQSICRQTLQDIEIICVDDGSTDRSSEIIDEFAASDTRVIVIHKTNTGYGNSMNLGMDAAAGKYIGIVESDDWIPEDMMQTLYECAEMNEVDFIKADFYRFVYQADGTIRRIYNHLSWDNKYYNRVLCPSDETETFRFVMNIWSGIYSTDFIRKHHICFNETPGASFQDNGFWFQTFSLAQRAYFLNKPLYMNRRDNPLSSVNNKEKVFASCLEYDYIREWIKRNLNERKRYLYLCAEGRIRNYLFTIDRIGDSFKPNFYRKFKEDYLRLYENGEIAETLLPERWKYRIERILENPEEACRKELEYRNKYMDVIGAYQDIIIYGAGKYARKAYERINIIGERNRVAYFAVTEMGKNPSTLFDIPVIEFTALPEDFKTKALVIPAVKNVFWEEVIRNIQRQGYCNYTESRIFFEDIEED